MNNKFDMIDLHMHSTVSDGTDTPEEILEVVREAGFGAFSITDHDAVKAAFAVRPLLREGDPLFIPGIELSCRDKEGKYHILGYGVDPDAAPIREVVGFGHDMRMKKVRARLECLRSEFGFTFTDDEIDGILSLDNPGKPHLGNLMVKHGYAESKEQAIKDFIDRCSPKSEYLSPEQAIEGIIGSGGIPVLAHPFYGSGDELILGEEMENRLRRLIGSGLLGIEAFYSGFSGKLCRTALELAERYDLFVTAGSDYHGKNKMVRLGDTGLDPRMDIPEGLTRFLKTFRE